MFTRNEAVDLVNSFTRLLYLHHPEEYFVERLGVRRESIEWSILPEYADCHCPRCGPDHKGEHVWDGTKDPFLVILRAIAEGKWIAIESAIGVGKTYFLACLTLYFLETFRNSSVVTIAPKEEQLRLHLWSEMSMIYPHFGLGELQSGMLKMNPPSDYWRAVAFVAGVSAEEARISATKAHGFHRPDQLILCEETPGIHEAVMSSFINTSTAEHNIIVAVGNPNFEADTLHQFSKRKDVTTIRISAFDHPNVVTGRDVIPGAQTRVGLDRLRTTYGDETARLFLSRARGISPKDSKSSLIKWTWCERVSRKRDTGREIKGTPSLGVDVADSPTGDAYAIAIGRGTNLLSIESDHVVNASWLGERVWDHMKSMEIDPECVGVDAVGVGASTINKLKELEQDVVALQSGGRLDPEDYPQWMDKDMTEEFNNLRSLMWWQMRIDLEYPERSGITLPDDPELFQDLTAPDWTTKGKQIVIESKEAIKKRLGRSPNKGDACVYWNFVRRNGIGSTTKSKVAFY